MVLLYRNNALLTPRYQHTPLVKTFKGCFYDTFGRHRFYRQSSSMKEAGSDVYRRKLTTERHGNDRKHAATYYRRVCLGYARCVRNKHMGQSGERVVSLRIRNSILRFFKIVWNENRSKERGSLCFEALSIRGKTFFFFFFFFKL